MPTYNRKSKTKLGIHKVHGNITKQGWLKLIKKLATLLSKFHDPNKDGLDPSYTWIKCVKASF